MGRRLDTGALKNMVKMADQSLYDEDELDPQYISEDDAGGGYFDKYNYDDDGYSGRKFRKNTRKGDIL